MLKILAIIYHALICYPQKSQTRVLVTPCGFLRWTNWSLGRFFFRVSPIFPCHRFHFTISPHSSHFISSALCWCLRRNWPAAMLFTDLQYRGFVAFRPSTRASVRHKLSITIINLFHEDHCL